MHHFAWLRSQQLTAEHKNLAQQYIPNHYVALLHGDVLVGAERKPGVTSVTSIDIHDIARSCSTYGVEQYFIVTPLRDQQKIVGTLLDFWQKGIGADYNRSRHEAIKSSTDAHTALISFHDQASVWQEERPVLFVFGTGKGLTKELIQRCDYLLPPVHGFTQFKHLSVRSAVEVVLDRWLGVNEKLYSKRTLLN